MQEPQSLSDGLKAVSSSKPRYRLTKLGEQMARLPVDPKIARMLIAAQKHDCMAEILVIVSALSAQDPRERPLEAREAAQKAHERFHDKRSDFLVYLNIWDSFQRERDKGLSQKQLMQWCRQYFLSPNRMREWRELHRQLADVVVEMGLARREQTVRQMETLSQLPVRADDADRDLSAKIKQKQLDKKQHRAQVRAVKEASYEQIHRALLTGLIANVGMKSPEGHDYTGARGSRFHLFPASALFKSKPKWVMAAELTETGKLYARDVAEIQPEWIEAEAAHLVRYHYFEPHWEQKRGEVVASERVTLYGLTVLPRRPVAYGRVAPEEAREIFIRGALVAQECRLNAPFFTHNQQLIREIGELEHKSRKQDVLVDEEALFAFYNQRLPAFYEPTGQDASGNPQLQRAKPLADIRTFEAWLKTAGREQPRLLFLSREDLMQHAAAHVTEEQFPPVRHTPDGKFALSYRFEPHHPMDGVTLSVPLTVLNRLNAAELEWLVPGMIREKLQLLIKLLPKQVRRVCVPVPDFITAFLENTPDRSRPILPQLAQAVAKHAGDMRLLEQMDLDAWAAQRLPEHCYFNVRVVDDGGQELACGRDLHALQQQLGDAAALTFRDSSNEFERERLSDWSIGKLPDSLKFARGKQQLVGYPGLQQEKDGTVALRLFDTPESAAHAHRQGCIALMRLQLKEQVKDLNKGIHGFTQAAMLLKHISADALHEDLTAAVCDRAFIGEDEAPRNEKDFKEQIKRARSRLPAVKEALSRHLQDIAAAYSALNSKLGKHPLAPLLREHAHRLLAAGFATRTPWAQLPRLPVYLQAMALRLEKYSGNPARDAQREADVRELTQMWQDKTEQLLKQNRPVSDELSAFAWRIEELRVSLFAQELKTPYPVSVKRLLKEWESLERGG